MDDLSVVDIFDNGLSGEITLALNSTVTSKDVRRQKPATCNTLFMGVTFDLNVRLDLMDGNIVAILKVKTDFPSRFIFQLRYGITPFKELQEDTTMFLYTGREQNSRPVIICPSILLKRYFEAKPKNLKSHKMHLIGRITIRPVHMHISNQGVEGPRKRLETSVVTALLRFMYNQPIKDDDLKSADLLISASENEVNTLRAIIEDIFIKKICNKNIAQSLYIANTVQSHSFYNAAIDHLKANFDVIVDTDEWRQAAAAFPDFYNPIVDSHMTLSSNPMGQPTWIPKRDSSPWNLSDFDDQSSPKHRKRASGITQRPAKLGAVGQVSWDALSPSLEPLISTEHLYPSETNFVVAYHSIQLSDPAEPDNASRLRSDSPSDDSEHTAAADEAAESDSEPRSTEESTMPADEKFRVPGVTSINKTYSYSSDTPPVNVVVNVNPSGSQSIQQDPLSSDRTESSERPVHSRPGSGSSNSRLNERINQSFVSPSTIERARRRGKHSEEDTFYNISSLPHSKSLSNSSSYDKSVVSDAGSLSDVSSISTDYTIIETASSCSSDSLVKEPTTKRHASSRKYRRYIEQKPIKPLKKKDSPSSTEHKNDDSGASTSSLSSSLSSSLTSSSTRSTSGYTPILREYPADTGAIRKRRPSATPSESPCHSRDDTMPYSSSPSSATLATPTKSLTSSESRTTKRTFSAHSSYDQPSTSSFEPGTSSFEPGTSSFEPGTSSFEPGAIRLRDAQRRRNVPTMTAVPRTELIDQEKTVLTVTIPRVKLTGRSATASPQRRARESTIRLFSKIGVDDVQTKVDDAQTKVDDAQGTVDDEQETIDDDIEHEKDKRSK